MTTGLLFDCDELVAQQLFSTWGQPHYKFDRCIGIVDGEKMIGAILLHNWNGNNIELSYYGEKTMTPGVIRCLARFIIYTFDPGRLTVVVSKRKRSLLNSLQNFGFKLEGAQRCYYGKQDVIRNTGIRLVMFRPRLDQLARYRDEEAGKAC